MRRLGVPPALPPEWRPAGVDVVEDHDLAPAELDALDAALTGCTLAIAETGSLVLAAGSADGRRALSLVPDVYLCVVAEDQVEPDLPAALPRIAGLIREERRPVVFVSGPVGHVRHRAPARGGRPRPAAPRRPARLLTAAGRRSGCAAAGRSAGRPGRRTPQVDERDLRERPRHDQ